jgi:hypothetical protein
MASAVALKMQTLCLSETLVFTYECTRCHNPEQHRHPHRRENLKSHTEYDGLTVKLCTYFWELQVKISVMSLAIAMFIVVYLSFSAQIPQTHLEADEYRFVPNTY